MTVWLYRLRCFIVNALHRCPTNTVLHRTPVVPTPWRQQGWGQGCCKAKDLEQWKPEPLTAVTRLSHRPVGALSCWKMKKGSTNMRWVKKQQIFVSKNNCICIYCACKITKLKISQGSAATRVINTNSTVKKNRKSVAICQNYGQKHRGPFSDSQRISTLCYQRAVLTIFLQVRMEIWPNGVWRERGAIVAFQNVGTCSLTEKDKNHDVDCDHNNAASQYSLSLQFTQLYKLVFQLYTLFIHDKIPTANRI